MMAVLPQALLVIKRPDLQTLLPNPQGGRVTQYEAYFIDIPAGSDAISAATVWVMSQVFPAGTYLWLCDPSTAREFTFQASWVPVT